MIEDLTQLSRRQIERLEQWQVITMKRWSVRTADVTYVMHYDWNQKRYGFMQEDWQILY